MQDYRATVLIVDDIAANLAVMSEILKSEYNIKVAKSGSKAIEMLSYGGIDLVLLDVNMPDMDGYEVCKSLKLKSQTQEIPIIFVTANTSSEDEERGFELGGVDYITKPFKPTTVKSRVKTHINLHLRQIELEKMAQTMQEQNEKLLRYKELIDKHIITSTTDLQGFITESSTAFSEISGYTKEELLGLPQSVVRHPDMPASFFENLWKTIKKDTPWQGEIKNLNKNGQEYWVKAFISPLFEGGKKVGYSAVRYDITDKKIIEAISITDGLTNIYNRRHFNETFPKILNSAKRDENLVCFLLLDIDHFKLYNDNYGHQMGDRVLIKFAEALKNSSNRADDMVFRLGGEEFGVLFRAQTKEKALGHAQRVKESIAALKIPHEFTSLESKIISASMGLVCEKSQNIESMDVAFKQADDLLYRAKELGRDTIVMQ